MELSIIAVPQEKAARLSLGALSLAFFASGVAALIDQTVWQRMLGIFAGSDAVTASIVVGAFLLGLGIGSLAAGPLADRLGARKAALAFAICELGIGGFALLSKPFLYDFVALQWGPSVHSRLVIFIVCFLGLLLPTFLMGCSLPLLAKAAVTGLAGAARRIGLLYGLNTLGAGLGALLGGWWLAGALGFPGALFVSASLNVLAAIMAMLAARQMSGREIAAEAAPEMALAADRRLILGWSLLVFVSGFVIVGLEILWVRLLGAFLQNNAYAFSSILAAFLLADGLGIVVGARLADRLRSPRTSFVLIQAAAVIVASVTVTLLYIALSSFGLDAVVGADAQRHRGAGLVVALALVALVVLPPSFLMGLSFPLVQKAVQRELATVGRRVGLVQLANIAGNALGGLCVGLLTLEWFGMIGTMLALGLCALAILIAEFLAADRQGPVALAGVGLVAALLAMPGNGAYWRAEHSVRPGDQAYLSEGRSGLALLRLRGEAGPMFIGAHSQSNIPFAQWHVLLGVIGPLVHPDPRDVLVIGVGAGGTPYNAGIRPQTSHIRAVELVAPVYDVLREFAVTRPDSAVARMFRDPRYEFIVGDGRHDIFTGGARYDLIQADAIYPESSMSGLLYSREFFELVRNALKPGGMFVQWAPTPRTVRTFADVFPYVVQLAPFAALIGSNQPISFDPGSFAQALRRPEIAAHIIRAGSDPTLLGPLVAGVPKFLVPGRENSPDINTDMHPRDEFYLTGG